MTTSPRPSAGAISVLTWSRRSSRKAWSSSSFASRPVAADARSRCPCGPLVGSFVWTTVSPAWRRCRPRSSACVVLPAPSIPSKATRIPRSSRRLAVSPAPATRPGLPDARRGFNSAWASIARLQRQSTLVRRPAKSGAMYDVLLVIDADSHKMENPVVFFDYLDAPYRDRLFSRTDRWGQQRLVVVDFNPQTKQNDLGRVFPQPEGPGKGAYCALHPATAI